jgi:hypothetical protein
MRLVGRAGCVMGLCLWAWACGSSDAISEGGDAGMRQPDSSVDDGGRGGQTPAAHGGNGAQAGNGGRSASGSGAGTSGMSMPTVPHARVTFRLTGVQ